MASSTYDDVRVFIESELKQQWTDTAIEWDNVATDMHSGPWVRVYLSTGIGLGVLNAGQRTVGSRVLVRHTGFVSFDVFTPINTGTSESNRLAQKLTDMFYAGRREGSIVLEGSEVRRNGELDSHYGVTLEIAFYRDSVRD